MKHAEILLEVTCEDDTDLEAMADQVFNLVAAPLVTSVDDYEVRVIPT